MIRINNKESKLVKKDISWGNFHEGCKGVERKGISPVIDFYLENKDFITIETVYEKEDFKKLEIGQKIDFKNYITDIYYIRNEKWDSLIYGDYDATLEKTAENLYNLKLSCDYKDSNYKILFELDENILIEKTTQKTTQKNSLRE